MIFKVTKPVHYFLIITLTLALLLLLVANLSSLVFADNANNLPISAPTAQCGLSQHLAHKAGQCLE
jgi:hypothetical protein